MRPALAAMLLPAMVVVSSAAQLPTRDVPPSPDSNRSAALHALEQVAERGKKADRAKVEKANLEFNERMTEFASAWNALIKVCEKGVWSAKQARQAHKAFERLVRSQGWVENTKQ
jgi:hypothetical protein